MELTNKTIIITGAGSGLGEELAIKLAQVGAKLILIGDNLEALSNVKKKISSKKVTVATFACDISNLDQVKQTVQKILKKNPHIDILVNNAGIWTDDELEKSDPSRRRRAIEVNALGNIQLTEEFLPVFAKRNFGHIFNVISTAAVPDIPAGGNTNWKSYGASKWAWAGYTKALTDSLRGTKIKVSSFFPGGFESNLYESAGRKNPHHQPWMMKTEDVADIVIFALSRPDDVSMERIVVTKMH